MIESLNRARTSEALLHVVPSVWPGATQFFPFLLNGAELVAMIHERTLPIIFCRSLQPDDLRHRDDLSRERDCSDLRAMPYSRLSTGTEPRARLDRVRAVLAPGAKLLASPIRGLLVEAKNTPRPLRNDGQR